MVNMTFTSQSSDDIRHKLNKIESAVAKGPGELLEVAFKVHNAREERNRKPVNVMTATHLRAFSQQRPRGQKEDEKK